MFGIKISKWQDNWSGGYVLERADKTPLRSRIIRMFGEFAVPITVQPISAATIASQAITAGPILERSARA